MDAAAAAAASGTWDYLYNVTAAPLLHCTPIKTLKSPALSRIQFSDHRGRCLATTLGCKRRGDVVMVTIFHWPSAGGLVRPSLAALAAWTPARQVYFRMVRYESLSCVYIVRASTTGTDYRGRRATKQKRRPTDRELFFVIDLIDHNIVFQTDWVDKKSSRKVVRDVISA